MFSSKYPANSRHKCVTARIYKWIHQLYVRIWTPVKRRLSARWRYTLDAAKSGTSHTTKHQIPALFPAHCHPQPTANCLQTTQIDSFPFCLSSAKQNWTFSMATPRMRMRLIIQVSMPAKVTSESNVKYIRSASYFVYWIIPGSGNSEFFCTPLKLQKSLKSRYGQFDACTSESQQSFTGKEDHTDQKKYCSSNIHTVRCCDGTRQVESILLHCIFMQYEMYQRTNELRRTIVSCAVHSLHVNCYQRFIR
jgi:hypothetical protein